MTKFRLANPCQNKESKAAFMLILRGQNQRFALTTIVNAHFWTAFMLILRGQNQRFETLIQNADPKRRSRE